MKVSFIVPAYDEAENIETSLSFLQTWREQGHEVILVDGGSADNTLTVATPLADLAFLGPKGRARQMNAGAARASGDLLLFLHADTVLPECALKEIEVALQTSNRKWGRFDVRLSGRHFLLRIVESLMNLRSRLTGIATGDQAIFIQRPVFEQLGGFADIPLMEDIEICQRLKQVSRPVCIRQTLQTSSRRWEQKGIMRTIALMWRLRLAYFLGVAPERLARQYR